MAWTICWMVFSSDTPENHPYISEQEMMCLKNETVQLSADVSRQSFYARAVHADSALQHAYRMLEKSYSSISCLSIYYAMTGCSSQHHQWPSSNRQRPLVMLERASSHNCSCASSE